MITVGVFSILGFEINLPVVAALLTIVGYSLNDTIVVFDRIREDLKIYRRETYGNVINHSINETLSRTIITSLTTFLVVLSLYLFGGTVIHDFAFALLIGVVVGTYSSIFVASPLLVEYFNNQQKRQAASKKK
jgi:preprotein translocase SecF subunit